MKYARQCDVTKEGMNEGYLVHDIMYIKYEKDLITYLRDLLDEKELDDEALLEETYEADTYYYTEWEDEDDFQYEEINGKLIEIQ